MTTNQESARKFVVSPGYLGQTFDVEVEFFDHTADLVAAATAEQGAMPDGLDGACHCYTDGTSPHALIRLSRESVNLSIVAHEAAHAAVHLAGFVNPDQQDGADEIIPWFAGELTAAIWAITERNDQITDREALVALLESTYTPNPGYLADVILDDFTVTPK